MSQDRVDANGAHGNTAEVSVHTSKCVCTIRRAIFWLATKARLVLVASTLGWRSNIESSMYPERHEVKKVFVSSFEV